MFGLLSTDEFVAELKLRLSMAERHIAIQLMTFDGDTAGLGVAELLTAAADRGVEVRLIVDCFAHRFVSDRPVSKPDVRDEYRRTLQMFDDLETAGVDLRFTHPNGWFNLFSLARNHKKLYVIDEVAYLGGVNVSDHNFAWHDFMVRVADGEIRRAVLADFDDTFAGRRRTVDGPIVTNASLEATFDELVSTARERVVVASPYALDRHLVRRLEASSAASKSVVIAGRNNFRFLQAITPYLSRRLHRAGVELYNYGRFSHSKFLLVDDDALLIGSSNFGRHSFWCNQEIGLVIRDRAFIAEVEAALATELVPVEPSGSAWRRAFGWAGSGGMEHYLRVYARLIAFRVPPLASPASVARSRPRARIRPRLRGNRVDLGPSRGPEGHS